MNVIKSLKQLFVKNKVQPKTKEELKKIIKDTIKRKGNKCNLNFIDTSLITDMSDLFAFSKFNGNISKWNTSNVEDMSWMFLESEFNRDISKWNISKVKNMSCIFLGSKFNQDISSWDITNIDTHDMYRNCPLNSHPDFMPFVSCKVTPYVSIKRS